MPVAVASATPPLPPIVAAPPAASAPAIAAAAGRIAIVGATIPPVTAAPAAPSGFGKALSQALPDRRIADHADHADRTSAMHPTSAAAVTVGRTGLGPITGTPDGAPPGTDTRPPVTARPTPGHGDQRLGRASKSDRRAPGDATAGPQSAQDRTPASTVAVPLVMPVAIPVVLDRAAGLPSAADPTTATGNTTRKGSSAPSITSRSDTPPSPAARPGDAQPDGAQSGMTGVAPGRSAVPLPSGMPMPAGSAINPGFAGGAPAAVIASGAASNLPPASMTSQTAPGGAPPLQSPGHDASSATAEVDGRAGQPAGVTQVSAAEPGHPAVAARGVTIAATPDAGSAGTSDAGSAGVATSSMSRQNTPNSGMIGSGPSGIGPKDATTTGATIGGTRATAPSESGATNTGVTTTKQTMPAMPWLAEFPVAAIITPAGTDPSPAAPAIAAALRPATAQLTAAMVGVTPIAGNGNDGFTRLTIAMAPPAIGTVSIQIDRTTDGNAVVAVSASHAATLAALQTDHAALGQILTQAGIPVDHRNISFHLEPVHAGDPQLLGGGGVSAGNGGILGGTGSGPGGGSGGGSAGQGQQPGQPGRSHGPTDHRGRAGDLPGTADPVIARPVLRRFGVDVMA